MVAAILGVILIGLGIGLIPLIISIIKHKVKTGIAIVFICGATAVINILIAIAVAVIASIVLLFIH